MVARRMMSGGSSLVGRVVGTEAAAVTAAADGANLVLIEVGIAFQHRAQLSQHIPPVGIGHRAASISYPPRWGAWGLGVAVVTVGGAARQSYAGPG